MSTRQHPGLPLAAAKRNRSTENRSIVNTNRPTKWRRANAGRDLPKKRARGTRRIGRESTRSAWSERHGGWTRAATDLYPHQWSWDSGFIPIGLAHLDTGRAARELLTLFRHQWKTGKVPHIVFNPEAPPDSYFPGAEHCACAAASPEAPPALHKLPVPAANPRNRRLLPVIVWICAVANLDFLEFPFHALR